MFSKSTEYALRATIFIAQKSSKEHKLGLAAIAEAIDSPRSFTAKILQQLTKGNDFIVSTPGPQGGFYLPENSKDLPVRKVLELMGESDRIDQCVLGLKQCSDTNPCPLHAQYKSIKMQLRDLFDRAPIRQLASGVDEGMASINNVVLRKKVNAKMKSSG